MSEVSEKEAVKFVAVVCVSKTKDFLFNNHHMKSPVTSNQFVLVPEKVANQILEDYPADFALYDGEIDTLSNGEVYDVLSKKEDKKDTKDK